ncbi:hypothetical protein MMC07_005642 [Pseudocyphellaria aurata]|nr:hypothetical protein [Pseudocyphellaria aurata]
MTSNVQPSTTYLPTIDAYNKWAETYDASPNFLPPLSTDLFLQLLTPLLATLPPRPILVDLGCGTARTTSLLLAHQGATILGLDASPAMLDIARQRCEECFRALPSTHRAHEWDLGLWDLIAEDDAREQALQRIRPQGIGHHGRLLHAADLVVSTLVLEHIPLTHFFRAAASLLRPGGLLVLTNMHADMGRVTQAGFRTPDGVKVRGQSYIHEVPDVLNAAREAGFEQPLGALVEIGVKEEDLSEEGALAEGKANEGARNAAGKWHSTGKNVLFGAVWRFVGEVPA